MEWTTLAIFYTGLVIILMINQYFVREDLAEIKAELAALHDSVHVQEEP